MTDCGSRWGMISLMDDERYRSDEEGSLFSIRPSLFSQCLVQWVLLIGSWTILLFCSWFILSCPLSIFIIFILVSFYLYSVLIPPSCSWGQVGSSELPSIDLAAGRSPTKNNSASQDKADQRSFDLTLTSFSPDTTCLLIEILIPVRIDLVDNCLDLGSLPAWSIQSPSCLPV